MANPENTEQEDLGENMMQYLETEARDHLRSEYRIDWELTHTGTRELPTKEWVVTFTYEGQKGVVTCNVYFELNGQYINCAIEGV